MVTGAYHSIHTRGLPMYAKNFIIHRNMEITLTFGKHAGKTLEDVKREDFEYLRWLSGYRYNSDGYAVEDPLEAFAEEIQSNNSCECINKEAHSSNCYLFVKGPTILDTEINLHELHGRYKFDHPSMAWIWTAIEHPTFVYTARALIDKKKLCWKCGKHMQPIGTARKHGKKTHSDWKTRIFHKKCWTKVKYSN
jgi:hypothetical protein